MVTAYYDRKSCGSEEATFNPVAIDVKRWLALVTRVGRNLHNGNIDPTALDIDMLSQNFKELEEGIKESIGKGYNDDLINEPSVRKMVQNTYAFSGAKSQEMYRQMQDLLIDDQGKIRPWQDFKTDILKLNDTYNVNYLQSEFQTAKRSAQASQQWQTFVANSDLFPNLEYRTIGDDRVRDDHEQLDRIIAPLDDAFWDTHYPPNGWRCRCFVQSTDKPASKKIPEINVDMGFRNNVGKTGNIFDESGHPFFSSAKENIPYRDAFELSKLIAPFTKHKGIEVSVWADANDLQANVRAGVLLRKQFKNEIKINPHIERKGWKNPEFTIDGVRGELKSLESHKGIAYGLRASKKQGANITIFNLDGIENLNSRSIISQLSRNITADRGRTVKDLYFIINGKAVKMSRQDVIDRKYEQLIKAIKDS